MARRIDTRTEGLDIYVHAARTFADTPWLHYGLFAPGERPTMPTLRAAQERHVAMLLDFLPPAPARVFDIGGGTGETAKLLTSRGYSVEMLTPSAIQAQTAREKLGASVPVHQMKFEDFSGAGPFDVCQFSESFQYVDLDKSLALIDRLLAPGGRLVIADCFRSDAYQGGRAPGGGHRWRDFVAALERHGFTILRDEDVTEMAAGSIALDQSFYRDFAAPVWEQVQGLLQSRRPMLYRLGSWVFAALVPRKERENIAARLRADYRSPEAFIANTSYRFLSIARRNETGAGERDAG